MRQKLARPGSTVFVADNLPVRILQVCIGENGNVWYQVGHWQGNRWIEDTVPAAVVAVDPVESLDMGSLWAKGSED